MIQAREREREERLCVCVCVCVAYFVSLLMTKEIWNVVLKHTTDQLPVFKQLSAFSLYLSLSAHSYPLHLSFYFRWKINIALYKVCKGVNRAIELETGLICMRLTMQMIKMHISLSLSVFAASHEMLAWENL